jgi:nicotinamide-nucleotide adenylyltransferase
MEVSMKRGLYIGRFQPFHLGHFNTLKEIEAMELVDELIIAVGSSLTSYTPRNPFSGGERLDMIRPAVEGKFDFGTYITGISDIEYNHIWVGHMVAQLPKFDMIFTNNPLVGKLFTDFNFKVVNTSMTDRGRYSSTAIRNSMSSGDPTWKYKVAPSTVKYIEEYDLVERVRIVNQTDAVIPVANQ